MSAIRICPIVEGHGEVEAVRGLLDRVWREVVGGTYAEVIRPIRQPRGRLVKESGVERAAMLARNILLAETAPMEQNLILIAVDADEDCAAELGPLLEQRARASVGDVDVACVLPVVEYETWFVGGVRTLGQFVELPERLPPVDPEGNRQGKGWVESRWRGPKYSETLDQPRLTAAFDLGDCREVCPSFDKLCRELGRRLA